MLPLYVYFVCFAVSLLGTIIAKYVIEYINFTREQTYGKRLEDINQRVDALLSYKFNETKNNNQIIDIVDYIEYENDLFTERDSLLEEIATQKLIYCPQLKTWIKR